MAVGGSDPGELYEAYAAGRIGRRTFIARLVGFGMSAAVATAYASSVGSVAVATGSGEYGDLYSDLYGNLYGDLYGDLYAGG